MSIYDSTTLEIGDGGTSGLIGTGDVEMGINSNNPGNFARLTFNRSDAYTVANDLSGFGTLTITGDGAATFTGDSTFENPGTNATYGNEADGSEDIAVVVTSGSTFLMDGTHVAPSGDYVIESGATLGGSGLIDLGGIGSISLAAGSFLAPGSLNTPGTLNIDAVVDFIVLDGSSEALVFRLGSASDQIVFGNAASILGELNFGDFNFITGMGFGAGTYDLFVFDDVFNNGLFLGSDTTGTLNGFASELNLDANTLSLTVIPEPATVGAILGALVLGLAFWRRKRA